MTVGIPMDPDDPKDDWQLRCNKVINDFGAALRELHETNPWPHQPLLPAALSQLAGDLWEFHHFNAADARNAWQDALSEFPRT